MTGTLVADGYSSPIRPVLNGVRGGVSAAHPLAVAAGQWMLQQGGSAVDAAIAAQAVLCVVAPDACGLGGDMFALVGDGGRIVAINGAGAAPAAPHEPGHDGANSITVPGLVDAWDRMHGRWGMLPLIDVLRPAIRLADEGFPATHDLVRAIDRQRARLSRDGNASAALLRLTVGAPFVQPALADLLRAVAGEGAPAFYSGHAASAIEARIRALGGALARPDLADHETGIAVPLILRIGDMSIALQPPPTQGILLGMALNGLQAWDAPDDGLAEHLCVELTEAAFVHRDDAGQGARLLDHALDIDAARAARRGGPRAYLHTAGVAAADADGLVVSSLVSVFDDFGSCVFVPELGIMLNNRAGGFTRGANAAAPGKRPVHTLAPAMLRSDDMLLALSTPGADGQVQTLLQVIDRIRRRGQDLATAIAAPRWRSEGGRLLIEKGHPAIDALRGYGHDLVPTAPGDMRFGSVACAGTVGGRPVAVADWRRDNWAGVV